MSAILANQTKVVIVSTGQPSTNPRMLKEADALFTAGYDVTLLYSHWSNWGANADEHILEAKPWKHQLVGGSNTRNKLTYFISKLRFKLVNKFTAFFKKEMRLSRNYPELLNKTIKTAADIYIGHNLATLPIVCKAAKKNHALCFFDFEDFHHGEHAKNSADFLFKKEIEKSYIPLLDGATMASKLIQNEYLKLFPSIKSVAIDNVFPLEFINTNFKPYKPGEQLKIFWFSQTIGKDRGLENILDALKILKVKGANFRLTLLGNLPTIYENELFADLKIKDLEADVEILKPVEPNEIFQIAGTHHIGLATETGHTLNRDICLTNKIFNYLLSGNAILLSDTKAQKDFYQNNKECCKIYKRNHTDEIVNHLMEWINSPKLLNEQRLASLALAKEKYNWEQESKKLIHFYDEMTS